ncbi:MAG: HDOD domain-containing protein [Xanthomonadales bacterium]|nr:HDOD domain-containing protein [Xanthomonadales bacterium]
MSLARLARMKPIDSLHPPHRDSLLAHVSNEVLPHAAQLDSDQEKDWYVYLLDGEVTLRGDSGEERISATSDRATHPIFEHPNTFEKALFQSEGCIARVNRMRYLELREQQANDDGHGMEVNAVEAVEMEANVLKRLFADYQAGTIPVPSIPEAALRVRQLMEDPDAGIMDLARYVETDPAMSGKVVAASNSAAAGGQTKISTVRDALVRLGMKPACNMISSLAMKELFDFPNARLRQTAQEVWRHSLLVGASARELSSAYAGNLDPDKSFLVGLLHDVGAVALLAYFDEYQPESAEFMVGGKLHEMTCMVSGMVVQKWEMDSDFVHCAETAGQWASAGADNEYAAALNLAKQQVHLIEGDGTQVPPVEEIAAFSALQPGIEDGIVPVLKDNDAIRATLDALG